MALKNGIPLGLVVPHRSPDPVNIQAVRAEKAFIPAVAPGTIELQRRNASCGPNSRP
jgi:hypothetical protein